MNETANEALNLIDQLKEQQVVFRQQLEQLHEKIDQVIDHLEKHFPGSPPDSYLPEIGIDNNATN